MSVAGLEREETFIEVEGGELLCVTDLPVGTPIATVVFCHGLTGDRVGPQRLLSGLAEELAMAGFLCVRFDFRGAGDSSGTFAETTFQGMCDDLEAVVSWTRARHPAPALVLGGLSIGGVPPALCASRIDGVRAVVLVSSDLIEDVYFDVPEQVPIRGGEFHLPDSFFRERETLRPLSALRQAGVPTKIFYGALDDKLAAATAHLGAAGIQVEAVRHVDHLLEVHDVRQLVAHRVVRWLRQVLADDPVAERPNDAE